MDTPLAIAALAALAQESRLAVFRLLVQAGPGGGMNASDIATTLGLPPSSLSFHLKELVHAGLIRATPNGRFITYAAQYETMQDLVGFLTANCCGGAAC
ncbi:ArsR/SmtB family transcription factor [Massilia sp. S19_KUP03_FR1]|uniref:ArsR/SmtB family transcription factor n=1 Tax=Massilia sp. S19_KUP03_FR1 TaxID=3025503 RepID=UPI002FCD1FD9